MTNLNSEQIERLKRLRENLYSRKTTEMDYVQAMSILKTLYILTGDNVSMSKDFLKINDLDILNQKNPVDN